MRLTCIDANPFPGIPCVKELHLSSLCCSALSVGLPPGATQGKRMKKCQKASDVTSKSPVKRRKVGKSSGKTKAPAKLQRLKKRRGHKQRGGTAGQYLPGDLAANRQCRSGRARKTGQQENWSPNTESARKRSTGRHGGENMYNS